MSLIDREKLLEALRDMQQPILKSSLLEMVINLITNAAVVDSEREIANLQANISAQEKLGYELQASNNRLRQVLCYYREECTGFEPSISIFNLKLDEALAATPLHSLAKHDNELSQCRLDADRYQFVRKLTPRDKLLEEVASIFITDAENLEKDNPHSMPAFRLRYIAEAIRALKTEVTK